MKGFLIFTLGLTVFSPPMILLYFIMLYKFVVKRRAVVRERKLRLLPVARLLR